MRHTDPRTDAYIQNAPEYAQNILKPLRILIHKACPDVCETLKWQFPHFEYKGRILCSFAAFKQHCAFTFRRAADLPDPKGLLQTGERSAMGHLGRIESIQNLPADDDMLLLLSHVMTLNEADAVVKRKAIKKSASQMPVQGELNAAQTGDDGTEEAL